MMKLRILNVAGTRPNFIKIAPIIKEMKRYPERIAPFLVHTGQHFDPEMSELFFKDLKLPEPDFYLGARSGPHMAQIAEIMRKFEKVILKIKPCLVLVVGDVNSTVACALCAAKLNVPVAHVEAGLRSFDRTMPEEINRVLTDAISDYLFITEESASVNLKREGAKAENIYFVGNVMIDTLIKYKKIAKKRRILDVLGLHKKGYAILTLHRPDNVDMEDALINILGAISTIQRSIRIVWPVHPRSRKMINGSGFKRIISNMPNLRLVPPMGYPDFLKLMMDSKFVLTDSGGIQEETTFLNTPCVTIRDNTERPVTVEEGTNTVAGRDKGRISAEGLKIVSGVSKKGRIPYLWDGKTAGRIVKILIENLRKRYGAN